MVNVVQQAEDIITMVVVHKEAHLKSDVVHEMRLFVLFAVVHVLEAIIIAKMCFVADIVVRLNSVQDKGASFVLDMQSEAVTSVVEKMYKYWKSLW